MYQAERGQCAIEIRYIVSSREGSVCHRDKIHCIKQRGVSVLQTENTLYQAERGQCAIEIRYIVSSREGSVCHRDKIHCIKQRGVSVP